MNILNSCKSFVHCSKNVYYSARLRRRERMRYGSSLGSKKKNRLSLIGATFILIILNCLMFSACAADAGVNGNGSNNGAGNGNNGVCSGYNNCNNNGNPNTNNGQSSGEGIKILHLLNQHLVHHVQQPLRRRPIFLEETHHIGEEYLIHPIAGIMDPQPMLYLTFIFRKDIRLNGGITIISISNKGQLMLVMRVKLVNGVSMLGL